MCRASIVVLALGGACARAEPQHATTQPPLVAQATPADAAVAPSPPDAAESDLPAWLPKPLPAHGYIVGVWGLAGGTQVVIDYDARTLRYVHKSNFKDREGSDQSADRTNPITPAQLDKLRALARAAQQEPPHGDEPKVTDVSEQFYALDGIHHVEITGTLFDDSELGDKPWRPIAGRLLEQTLTLGQQLAKR